MRGWVGPTITLFYITTSRTGGFARKLDVEKETERIYAGVEEPYSYTPVLVAKGVLCFLLLSLAVILV